MKNGRQVEFCLELGADGVHVGGLDPSVREARAALGPDLIVGASCYGERSRAERAAIEGPAIWPAAASIPRW